MSFTFGHHDLYIKESPIKHLSNSVLIFHLRVTSIASVIMLSTCEGSLGSNPQSGSVRPSVENPSRLVFVLFLFSFFVVFFFCWGEGEGRGVR